EQHSFRAERQRVVRQRLVRGRLLRLGDLPVREVQTRAALSPPTTHQHAPRALFTTNTSPNNGFKTVHELAAVFAVADSGNKLPLSPKVILAFELSGQADAGENKGTYLELGIRPSIKLGKSPATLSIP